VRAGNTRSGVRTLKSVDTPAPIARQRTPMTNVRIAHAEPAGEIVTTDAPEELTARLLHAAGASVAGVDIDVTAADIDELSAQVTVTRIGLSGPGGSAARHGGSRPGPGHGGRRERPSPARRRATGPAGRTGIRRRSAQPVPRPRAAGRPAGHPSRPAPALRAAQPVLHRRPGPVGPRPRFPPPGRRGLWFPPHGRRLWFPPPDGRELFSRRRRPDRDPVLGRAAAPRIRRPGPGDLRRRLPRRHGRLRR
jgi:hypothetical protein